MENDTQYGFGESTSCGEGDGYGNGRGYGNGNGDRYGRGDGNGRGNGLDSGFGYPFFPRVTMENETYYTFGLAGRFLEGDGFGDGYGFGKSRSWVNDRPDSGIGKGLACGHECGW